MSMSRMTSAASYLPVPDLEGSPSARSITMSEFESNRGYTPDGPGRKLTNNTPTEEESAAGVGVVVGPLGHSIVPLDLESVRHKPVDMERMTGFDMSDMEELSEVDDMDKLADDGAQGMPPGLDAHGNPIDYQLGQEEPMFQAQHQYSSCTAEVNHDVEGSYYAPATVHSQPQYVAAPPPQYHHVSTSSRKTKKKSCCTCCCTVIFLVILFFVLLSAAGITFAVMYFFCPEILPSNEDSQNLDDQALDFIDGLINPDNGGENEQKCRTDCTRNEQVSPDSGCCDVPQSAAFVPQSEAPRVGKLLLNSNNGSNAYEVRGSPSAVRLPPGMPRTAASYINAAAQR